MFVRLKSVQSNGRRYQYLQIVENRREGVRVRQHIVGNLGRLDELLETGDLDRVIRQLVEHCPSVKLVRAQAAGALAVESDKLWGPVLIVERIWEELGLKELLRSFAARKKKRFDFDWERMIFAQVLQRLLEPGSDLRGSKWIETVHEPAFAGLQLAHFYRSLGWLWEKKQEIELALYRRELDLFNAELELVFFDTTSTYFEGSSLAGWAKLGKSKDHRPDHLQLVIGVVMRRDGFPIGCEIWPGNTADVTTLKPIIAALRERFTIGKVVVVCDRGMVSAANLEALEAAGYQYIVGMKMRNLGEVRDEVLGRAGRYHEVDEKLQVKEVHIDERRYVICYNPDEAHKDRHDREAIVAKLRDKLASGGVKRLINNRGYRRYLKLEGTRARVDEGALKSEARYDGKYVLRTTTELPAEEVARAYKDLTWIERLWRELKDVVELRPIFHWRKKQNVKGHIFSCFLALHVAAFLRHKLARANLKLPWDEVIRDLAQLRAVLVQLDGERYLMRSPLKGCAGQVFAALGVKVPPLAQPL
jgi:Transposase DDE domain